MIKSRIYEIVPERDLPKLNDRVLRLPQWRRRKTLSYLHAIDRLQCALAYELLEDLLSEAFGVRLSDHEILYDPMGKPSLSDHPGIHITLSHSPTAVIAAVADHPIGCDIETIPPLSSIKREGINPSALPMKEFADIMDYCYSQGERRIVAESLNPMSQFTELWTLKESIFKIDNSFDIEVLDTVSIQGFIRRTIFGNSFVATVAAPIKCTSSIPQIHECTHSNNEMNEKIIPCM